MVYNEINNYRGYLYEKTNQICMYVCMYVCIYFTTGITYATTYCTSATCVCVRNKCNPDSGQPANCTYTSAQENCTTCGSCL